MNWKALLASGLASATLAGGAFAQGANDCANAQAISGLGPFMFDNTNANTDGPADCSNLPCRRDVWFLWTAPMTGGYKLETCNQTSLSTRCAAYDAGTCPPTSAPLGCAASSCAQQTSFSFPTVAGNQYLLRIGSKQVGQSGTGTFDMTFDPCYTISDDQFEENDTCAAAVVITDGNYPNLFVSKTDPDYYIFEVPPGGTLQVDWTFSHAMGDIDIFMWDDCTKSNSLAGSTSGNDNEQIIWTNTGSCAVFAHCRTEHWFPDVNADCNTYTMTVSGVVQGAGCGTIGTNYCTAENNSTGQPASIEAGGSLVASDNDLTLTAKQLPPNQFGYFLAGMGSVEVFPVPNSQGRLCIGGAPQARFNSQILNSGAMGEFSAMIDISAIPLSPPVAAMPGDTWNFQSWYRDQNPTNTSNFTDAVAITYQ